MGDTIFFGSLVGNELLAMVPLVRFGYGCGVLIGNDNDNGSPAMYVLRRDLSYWPKWAYKRFFLPLQCDIIDFQRAKMSDLTTGNLTRGVFYIVLNGHQVLPQKGLKSCFIAKEHKEWTRNYIVVCLLSLTTPGRKYPLRPLRKQNVNRCPIKSPLRRRKNVKKRKCC